MHDTAAPEFKNEQLRITCLACRDSEEYFRLPVVDAKLDFMAQHRRTCSR